MMGKAKCSNLLVVQLRDEIRNRSDGLMSWLDKKEHEQENKYRMAAVLIGN